MDATNRNTSFRRRRAGSSPKAASTGEIFSLAAWSPVLAWPASDAVAKSGIDASVRSGPSADANVLSVDSGPASRHSGGERQVPWHQLPDRPGRRLRHRALRRRGQEQAKHLGRLCRPDAVRRNVGVHQGGRHRAVGQLHPEGSDRRHHSVDPRGMHGRRQAVQLAVPSRRGRLGLALRHHDQGGPCRTPRRRPGTSSSTTRRRSSIRRPRPGARPSIPTAGARSRRSRTA